MCTLQGRPKPSLTGHTLAPALTDNQRRCPGLRSPPLLPLILPGLLTVGVPRVRGPGTLGAGLKFSPDWNALPVSITLLHQCNFSLQKAYMRKPTFLQTAWHTGSYSLRTGNSEQKSLYQLKLIKVIKGLTITSETLCSFHLNHDFELKAL